MPEVQVKKIVFDRAFERKLKKYKKNLSEKEKDELKKRVKIFKNNVFDPRLETHKLGGKLRNYWAFSINFTDRILFRFLGEGKVFFIDIGDHSIYR